MNREKPSGEAYDEFVIFYNDATSKGKRELANGYNTTVSTLANWIHQGDTGIEEPQEEV
ncbi:hypothetical protein LCGC14_0917380 [marine sediment metagenome]|uniref:Uncharacterized protein n=1 Tax=marine sediment metagenome TaxID=412755 RepID=A0A0F9PCK6_9ZZZZ